MLPLALDPTALTRTGRTCPLRSSFILFYHTATVIASISANIAGCRSVRTSAPSVYTVNLHPALRFAEGAAAKTFRIKVEKVKPLRRPLPVPAVCARQSGALSCFLICTCTLPCALSPRPEFRNKTLALLPLLARL